MPHLYNDTEVNKPEYWKSKSLHPKKGLGQHNFPDLFLRPVDLEKFAEVVDQHRESKSSVGSVRLPLSDLIPEKTPAAKAGTAGASLVGIFFLAITVIAVIAILASRLT